MKRLLVFLLLLNIVAFAQAQITFNKIKYYYGDSVNTYEMIQSAIAVDSFLYFTNNIIDSLNNRKLSIVKTDLIGNEIKKLTFGGNSEYFGTYPGNSMILDKDSNILICSSYYDLNNNQYEDGYLIKLNLNLDTLWIKTYDLPGHLTGNGCPDTASSVNWSTAIKQTLDGGYIVAGNYGLNCSIANQRSYLLKLDTAGNVEWTKMYSVLTTIFDIETAIDSGFYFPIYDQSDLVLAKIDKYGSFLWSTKVNSHQDPSYPMEAVVLDSNYIIVGSSFWKDFGVNYERGLTISKVNYKTQTLVWEKDFYLHENFDNPNLHQSMSLEVRDGHIYVSSTAFVINHDQTEGGYKGILLKLNSNGDSLWSRYYGIKNFPDYCQFNDLLLMGDGGFMAVGYHGPRSGHYNWGAWLVRMDSLGFCPGAQTVSVPEYPEPYAEQSMLLYPNPAYDFVTVQLQLQIESNDKAWIEIMDVSGKKVATHSLEQNQMEQLIEFGQLSTGIYHFILKVNGQALGIEKLLIIK